jgi:hypothetical protein
MAELEHTGDIKKNEWRWMAESDTELKPHSAKSNRKTTDTMKKKKILRPVQT